MVFMASFRSSCSFVKNSFMDLESSVAAMRFLRGGGQQNRHSEVELRHNGPEEHNTASKITLQFRIH